MYLCILTKCMNLRGVSVHVFACMGAYEYEYICMYMYVSVCMCVFVGVFVGVCER